MENTDYITLAKRNWFIVLLGAILGVVIAWIASASAVPLYTATASVYFSVSSGKTPAELTQGAQYAQNQMDSYANLVTTRNVLDSVIEGEGLNESAASLANSIEATVPPNTVLLNIAVERASADEAAEIANALATELTAEVETISPKDEQGDTLVSPNTVQTARAPTAASSPDMPRNLLIGLLIGALAGIAAAAVRESLRKRNHAAGAASVATTAVTEPAIATTVEPTVAPTAIAEDESAVSPKRPFLQARQARPTKDDE